MVATVKPIPVVPYTDEDWYLMRAATVRWMFRHKGPFPLASIYVPADRRDAALMYRAQGPSRKYRDLWLPSTLWTEIRGAPLVSP